MKVRIKEISKKDNIYFNLQYQHILIPILSVHNYKVLNFAYYQLFVNKVSKT